MDNLTKTCSKCKQTKPVADFGKYAKAKDGLKSWCKTCASADSKRWYDANKDKHYEAVKRGRKRYREEHPLDVPPDDLIIAEYQAGATLKELAAKYGMSFAGIAYRLEINGIKRRQFSPFKDPTFYDKIRQKQKETTPRGENHSRFVEIPLDQLRKEYEAGMKTVELGKKYGVLPGTIIYKLKQAGAKTRPRTLSKIAQDGHLVDSRLELLVDNWLSEHHIEHVTHPKLPWSNHQLGDFLVESTVYIEVWGVQHRQDYENMKATKLLKYSEYGLPLISLYPKDFEAGGYADILAAQLLGE